MTNTTGVVADASLLARAANGAGAYDRGRLFPDKIGR